ncbi:MAG: leucine-rich repeat domain-containing protein [Oscillospiraceae bacterium]|nr:leucine-rich repeat domain-containing protein [Oscillospiraceae bacterium]
MEHIHQVIKDGQILRQGYLFRDGYCFTAGSQSNIYDAIVIKYPQDCVCWNRRLGTSAHTLEEHIDLINRHQLETAVIITGDIGFVARCPSLKELSIYISDEAPDHMDLSALYEMPEIRSLNCRLTYGGPDERKSTELDYSKIPGLRDVSVSGKGHRNYHQVDTLERLWLSENRTHRDLMGMSCSKGLKSLTLLQCGVKTLEGIGLYPNLQEVYLSHQRSLVDVSALAENADSLRALSIEACPKITDFSFLYKLHKLEHLNLMGNNILPDLKFLDQMPKLKTFVFSMRVADNDLTPCLRLPYASVSKGKREYNLKDRDLPKKGPMEPFTLR